MRSAADHRGGTADQIGVSLLRGARRTESCRACRRDCHPHRRASRRILRPLAAIRGTARDLVRSEACRAAPRLAAAVPAQSASTRAQSLATPRGRRVWGGAASYRPCARASRAQAEVVFGRVPQALRVNSATARGSLFGGCVQGYLISPYAAQGAHAR